MPNPPRQSRSVESTQRMLVAAEELFRLGGPDALTVEAVVERAGTSTGSFYARFGSRRGLFVAMHERFLETFGTALRQAATDALARPTLREALDLYFGFTLATVRRHRDTMHFHMIHNAHDAEMRARGNEVSRGGFGMIMTIVETHRPRTTAVDFDKLNLVARSFFGLILETVLFDPDEASGHYMSDEQRAACFTDMVLAYL